MILPPGCIYDECRPKWKCKCGRTYMKKTSYNKHKCKKKIKEDTI